MPDTGVQPPYLDPSQYPAYLDLQRKQMLAQTLMGAFQQANQTPAEWNSMRVVPRRSGLQNVATLASALLAGKAVQGANQAQQRYFQGLYGGGDTSGAPASSATPAPSLAPPPADPNEQSVQPLIARNGQSFSQAVGGGAPQPPHPNPMLLTGDPRTSQVLFGMLGPEEYGKALAGRYAPLDLDKKLTEAGITDPALRRQIIQANIAKENYIAPVGARGGETMLDPSTRQPFFTAPQNGVQTIWTLQGPVQSAIPGAPQAQADIAGATTGAKEANTPHYEPDPFHPGQFNATYPPTPPALQQPGQPKAPKVTTPSSISGGTAADLESQKEGAKAGQAYATELSKNATGATEVRRSLSELKNLAHRAAPNAMNEGKMKLGSYMIAAGMSPESVASFLGVDVGALQAAQKQTATLAVNTIHSMTSRGTNFDLDTFMRNNPNLNMGDPSGFDSVVDYMDNKAKQEIAKQKDFAEWKKGHTPDEWETGHTAHWLDLQNQNIDAGKSNSRPPLSSFVRP
jgi:hypothetical protein